MKRLTKDDLHLMGSAGSLDALKSLIVKNLYWDFIDTKVSEQFESRLGQCNDVINGNGLKEDMVIIHGNKGRWSLYRINDDTL